MCCLKDIRIFMLLGTFIMGFLFGQSHDEESLTATELKNRSIELYRYSVSDPDSAWKALSALKLKAKQNEFWDEYRRICLYGASSLSRAKITTIDPFYALKEIEQLKDSLHRYLGGDSLDLADMYGIMSMVYRKVGDTQNMQKVSEAAIELYQALGDSAYWSSSCQNLALAFRMQGDWVKALQYNQKALSLWRASSRPEKFKSIALTLTNAGQVAGLLKQWDEAKRLYKQALEMDRTIPKAHAAHELAYIHLEHDEPDSAHYYWKLSKTILDKQGKVLFPTVVAEIESQLLLLEGKLPEALAAAKKAKEARQGMAGLPMYSDYARGERKIAFVFEKMNQPDSALFYLDKAISYLTLPNSTQAFPDNLMYKQEALPIIRQRVDVLRAAGRLEEALSFAENAIELIHQLRSARVGEASKLLLNGASREFTDRAFHLIDELLEKAKNARERETYFMRAWAVSEAYHAAILVNDLAENEKFQRAQLPDSLKEKEQAQRWEISFHTNRLQDAVRQDLGKDSIRSIREDLFEAEETYRKFRDFLGENWPIFHSAAKHSHLINQKVSFDQVAENQMLISYFVGNSSLFTLSYFHGENSLYKQPVSSGLNSRISSFLDLINQKEQSQASVKAFTSQAADLYSLLLQRPLKEKTPRALLIIPDAALSRVPFEALMVEEGNLNSGNEDFRTLSYLLTRYDIRYTYALRMFANSPSGKAHHNQLAVFAPTYSGSLSLPQNAEVAPALLDVFQGVDFSGEEGANKAFFNGTVPQYSMLHLALHGESDTTHISQSYLQFPLASGDDNRLYTHEIYNLRLPGNLISLASCELGDGRLEAGEGLMSLGRAFQYAGAATVLSSRWKADARVTGKIFPAFYRYLAAGKSSDEAFALARRDFLQEAPPSLAHPFYWANFAHWGAAYEKPGAFPYWLLFGALVIIGFLLFFNKRSR